MTENTMRVGINGMGRIGRLALRAALGAAERGDDDPRRGNRLDVVHLNEVKGGAAATAHLLEFDSVQRRWRADMAAEGDSTIRIADRKLGFSVRLFDRALIKREPLVGSLLYQDAPL